MHVHVSTCTIAGVEWYERMVHRVQDGDWCGPWMYWLHSNGPWMCWLQCACVLPLYLPFSHALYCPLPSVMLYTVPSLQPCFILSLPFSHALYCPFPSAMLYTVPSLQPCFILSLPFPSAMLYTVPSLPFSHALSSLCLPVEDAHLGVSVCM